MRRRQGSGKAKVRDKHGDEAQHRRQGMSQRKAVAQSQAGKGKARRRIHEAKGRCTVYDGEHEETRRQNREATRKTVGPECGVVTTQSNCNITPN